jgi:uncharacterized phage infection (PIP) family protein YhgE
MTQFNLARLSRRTGGLDRLANEYQQQIAAMTDQYSKGFSEYQRRVGEQMAPFEAAMAQYQQVAQPQYQSQLAEYNAKLEAYRQQLADLERDPVIERTARVVTGKTWYGKKKYGDITYFEPKEIPTFSAQAPTAPDIPQAPEIEQFDSSQFEAKRGQIGQTVQREVGERRAARLNVTRRNTRTMLQGEQA